MEEPSARLTVKFDIPFADLEISNEPMRGFTTEQSFEFGVSYKSPFAVPISKQFTEGLNAISAKAKPGENPGVARAAFLVEKLTSAYSLVKEVWKEGKFYDLTARNPETTKLFGKLGGDNAVGSFDVTARKADTPVGMDPIKYITTTLRRYTTAKLHEVERKGKLNPGTDREWIGYGNDQFVSLYTEIDNRNIGGASTKRGSTVLKYGFRIEDQLLGYIDDMERRVKLYGSKYDRNATKPITFVNKIYDPSQPGLISVDHSTATFSAYSNKHIPQVYMSEKGTVEALSIHSLRLTVNNWTSDVIAG